MFLRASRGTTPRTHRRRQWRAIRASVAREEGPSFRCDLYPSFNLQPLGCKSTTPRRKLQPVGCTFEELWVVPRKSLAANAGAADGYAEADQGVCPSRRVGDVAGHFCGT